MRSITIFFAIVGVLLSHVAYAQSLRVLTYNIHHGEGRDGVWDLNRIADIINATSPDLVALQEVDQGTTRSGSTTYQLNTLAHLTGMRGIFGRTINLQGGQYGNGVLIRSGITVKSITNHALPNPASGEQRGALELQLSMTVGGAARDFEFFATHLDHSNAANRAAQIAAINALAADSDMPGILAGDFNSRPSSAEYASLAAEWGDATNPGIGRTQQIDYVMYRGAEQWEVPTPGSFIINATTAIASDHYPFLAVLELQSVAVPEPTTVQVITFTVAPWLCRRFRRRCR